MWVSELLSINYRNTPAVLFVPACDFVFHAPVFASRLLCLLGSSALLLIPLDFHIPVLFYPVGNVISTPVSPLLNLVAQISPILVFSPVLELMIKLRHKMVLCWPSIFASTWVPCGSKIQEKSNPTKTTFPLPLRSMCFVWQYLCSLMRSGTPHSSREVRELYKAIPQSCLSKILLWNWPKNIC